MVEVQWAVPLPNPWITSLALFGLPIIPLLPDANKDARSAAGERRASMPDGGSIRDVGGVADYVGIRRQSLPLIRPV